MESKTTKQTNEITKRISFCDSDNKNLSLSVFGNGNTHQTLHNIEKLSVGKWERLNNDTETRKITIRHDNDTETEIILFRDI